jgi:thiamine kinase-like enzyme
MPSSDADAVARVRDALAVHPDTRALADARIERLPGGVVGRGWRATWRGQRWFVRLDDHDRRSLGADPDSEARLLQLASDLGIAPRLVACVPAARLLVTEYIEGRAWSEAAFADPAALRHLGELLARLHAAPIDPVVRRLDFATQARMLEAQVEVIGDARLDLLRRTAERAWQRLASTSLAPRSVPCHNDLHPRNVVEDVRQAWLVDWEYGGLGDPLFDLAPVYERIGKCKPLFDAFGEGYGTAWDRLAPHMQDACWTYNYVQWLWYRAFVGTAGVTATGVKRALERLSDRLDAVPVEAQSTR